MSTGTERSASSSAGRWLILAVFIFIVGDIGRTCFKKRATRSTSDVRTAAGLEPRPSVKMAGVKIGFVKDIRLSGSRARVVMNV